eukprot:2549415-Pyramimonas_sp.AAC.1
MWSACKLWIVYRPRDSTSASRRPGAPMSSGRTTILRASGTRVSGLTPTTARLVQLSNLAALAIGGTADATGVAEGTGSAGSAGADGAG